MLSRRRLLLLFTALAAAFGIALLILFSNSQSAQLQKATALLSSDPGQVSQLAAVALEASPDSLEWLDLAAVASERTRDYAAAVGYLQRLNTLQSLPAERQLKLARLAELSGDLLTSESVLRLIIGKDHTPEAAVRQLANLLLAECRRFETQPLLRQLVQNRSFLLDELAMLGSREELLSDEVLLKAALNNTSSRPLALMAQASAALFLGKPNDALAILDGVSLPPAGQAEFVSVIARAHMGLGDEAGLAAWAQRHSGLLETHPDGAWCLAWLSAKQGRLDSAREFFLKTLSLDYNHRAALQQLGSLLAAADQPESARPLLERAQLLHEVELLLHRILVDDQTAPQMLRIAAAMEQLGRLQEAWAWHMAIAGYHPSAAAASSRRSAELEQMLNLQPEAGGFPEQLRQKLAAIALTDRPPTGSEETSARAAAEIASKNRASLTAAPEPRFEDHAESLGIREPWFYGQSTSEPRGLSVLQGFGGGVAAIDFDNDLWTDLCFIQGNSLPPSPDPRSADILFRNLRGKSAARTTAALPPDLEYGQGIAVGDFNDDGFKDLLIASTAGIRLLQNNGDGSFIDVSGLSLPASVGWVTSCAIADVTGDGISDIFEVRYADGSEPQTKLCPSGPAQLPRSCRPDLFPAASDRLLIGDGSGSFTVASAESFPPDEGRGLGLVIGDFDESGRNSVFISNDMTPNALRVLEANQVRAAAVPGAGNDAKTPAVAGATATNASAWSLVDVAPLRGCAVNGAGRIQAGMGIAWGDFNRDDLCDFFVTNFLSETNTLFASAEGGFFEDLSSSTGADAGSFDLLSFGAQAVDANLDGLQDLFVLNGHVDDYQHFSLPWKMPPAAWIAAPNGRFQRGSPEVFGRSGMTPALGRALVTLDWNRDGHSDLAATFLDRHPALYLNVSRAVGSPLRIRAVGTRSCRHPVGAILSLDCDDRAFPRQRAWVTAGDGYYSACEHTVTFALSVACNSANMSIRWPSENEQQHFAVTADSGEFALVEGRATLYSMPQ
jgi:tetratricopeptide (TPR) repeat protein